MALKLEVLQADPLEIEKKLSFVDTIKDTIEPVEKLQLEPLTGGGSVKTDTGLDLEPIGATLANIKPSDNPSDKMDKFQKILDILGRPGYAVKSAISELQNQQFEEMRKQGYDPESLIDRQKFSLLRILSVYGSSSGAVS